MTRTTLVYAAEVALIFLGALLVSAVGAFVGLCLAVGE